MLLRVGLLFTTCRLQWWWYEEWACV